MSFVFSIALLAILSILPFFMFLLIKFNKSKLTDDGFQEKFGSLYSDQDLSKFHYIKLFQVLRRALFVIIALYIDFSPGIQITLYLMASLFLICFFLNTKPFETPYINKMEIFNECCVYTLLLCYTTFTDSTTPVEFYMNMGLASVGIILFNFLFNLSLLIGGSINGLRKVILRKIN